MATFLDINLEDTRLTASERQMLEMLLKVRRAYIAQDRPREAHATGKALAIVWHFTRRDGTEPELPRTDFGALDINLPLATAEGRRRG